MNVEFHDPDDEHAAFPHRVLITNTGMMFIICAQCDHWVNRTVPDCGCASRCHAQAELVAEVERRSVDCG